MNRPNGVLVQRKLLKHLGLACANLFYCAKDLLSAESISDPLQIHFYKVNTLPLELLGPALKKSCNLRL